MKNHKVPSSEGLVPQYIRDLQIYQAGKPISELVREKGLKKVSKLASNENPLGPSPFAIREMTKAIWDLHNYPDMHAYDLKSSLAELYKIKKENIVLGNGSEGIMSYIVRTFLGPGDEIVTSENTFIGFYILAKAVGAYINMTPLTEDYRYDVKKMAKAVSKKTKIIYVANPNNPTGTFITKKEFDFLMEHVPSTALVILDEAYFEFAQGQPEYPDSMEYRYDNVLTLRTFSKAYGLAGIRAGYGLTHEELIGHLHKVKLPFEPNLMAQIGAVGALQDRPHLNRTLQNNSENYLELFNYLTDKQFRPIPSVCNFICVPTNSPQASEKLYQLLLDEGVIIRPLAANGMANYIRISIGNKNEMDHFYSSFNKILPQYDQEFKR